MAWKFDAGEELLARALEERRKHGQEPPRSPYFNTGVLAVSATLPSWDMVDRTSPPAAIYHR